MSDDGTKPEQQHNLDDELAAVDDLDVTPEGAAEVIGGTPPTAGKVEIQDVHVTKNLDVSSPKLWSN